MSRLIWSPNALADVQHAYRFLVLKDKDAAKRAARAIRDGVKAIGQCPEIGRPTKGLLRNKLNKFI
jgi:plasmid stabilization system protein ParE